VGLVIVTLALGPLQNNTYLVGDPATQTAVVIDPSFDSQVVLDELKTRGWDLHAIWLTHAHFDHLAGGQHIVDGTHPNLPVGLHPADMDLWRERGGAAYFGIEVDMGPEPALRFYQGQRLALGQVPFEVRHAPGHTRGHVIFYCQEAGAAFVGDVIFQGSIGRTDLPNSSQAALLHSIRTQVFTLPDETRLLPGHGPETTVGVEKRTNPFV